MVVFPIFGNTYMFFLESRLPVIPNGWCQNRLRGAFQQCGARCWEISDEERYDCGAPKDPPKRPDLSRYFGGLGIKGVEWLFTLIFWTNTRKLIFFNRRYTDNTSKRGVKRIRMDATYFVEQIDVAVAFYRMKTSWHYAIFSLAGKANMGCIMYIFRRASLDQQSYLVYICLISRRAHIYHIL